MFLGVEIGGTKLQLAVGLPGQPPREVTRLTVQPAEGGEGIRRAISREAAVLIQQYPVEAVGIGFGGPVDEQAGIAITSHQIAGWDQFPLAAWSRQTLGRPSAVGNDCDVAALGEAHSGAGKGFQRVFYVTVGSGIGGGMVIAGRPFAPGRPAAAEIGHLRPGPQACDPRQTVESIASGWGIAEQLRARLRGEVTGPLRWDRLRPGANAPETKQHLETGRQINDEFVADLKARCDGDWDRLTTREISQAAGDGNELAREVLRHAVQTLGWAIAQVITLMAPEVIVVGGGVAMIGEQLFLSPLRDAVAEYVFPPLRASYRIVPSDLGADVVLYGAILLAARQAADHRE